MYNSRNFFPYCQQRHRKLHMFECKKLSESIEQRDVRRMSSEFRFEQSDFLMLSNRLKLPRLQSHASRNSIVMYTMSFELHGNNKYMFSRCCNLPNLQLFDLNMYTMPGWLSFSFVTPILYRHHSKLPKRTIRRMPAMLTTIYNSCRQKIMHSYSSCLIPVIIDFRGLFTR